VERSRLAVALPTDPSAHLHVRLTLTFGAPAPEQRPRLRSIHAGFGPPLMLDATTPEERERAENYRYLYALHQEADLGSLVKAAGAADPARLRRAVELKTLNPAAAIAGALLLAGAGRIADIEDWPRNLMEWFPQIPDGVVLWVEALRAAHERGERDFFGVHDLRGEAASALLQLPGRGVPLLADVTDLAERQVRWLLRQPLAAQFRTELGAVGDMLDQAARISLNGGHFRIYAGLPRPSEMLGQGALSTREIWSVVRATWTNHDLGGRIREASRGV
jgi:hypothetical protein